MVPMYDIISFFQTQSEWNTYFLFVSVVTMYGVIVFLIWGSGDLQPWARSSAGKATQKTNSITEANGPTKCDADEM